MLTRFKNLRYVKREVIFLLDLFLSTFSTLISLLYVLSLFHISQEQSIILSTTGLSLVATGVLILIFAFHKSIVRYFSIGDTLKIVAFSAIKSAVCMCFLIFLGYKEFPYYYALIDLLSTSFLMIVVRGVMISTYNYVIGASKEQVVDSFIYSTRGSNPSIVSQINNDANSKFQIVGFLTTNHDKVDSRISGQKVYYVKQDEAKLKSLFVKNNIKSVIFTSNDALKLEKDNLVAFCMHNHIAMNLVGEMKEVDETTGVEHRNIKPIQIEDLLERPVIEVDIDKISADIKDKVVMVTGAAGSIGSEIARQVASFGAKQLVLFDSAETPLHDISLEFNQKFAEINIVYVLGDVRSKDRVTAIMETYKPSIVFHAAAYKHVPAVEANPCEGVLTNVWGSLNVAKRAVENGVKKFVMISTDKAVNPTNVMGASKRIAEMCVQSMNRDCDTEFITTRFGNVLGSNGSVIPLFKDQIAKGGPVTVTHPEIIRYFMTIPEACRLVLQAATMGHGGEILVFDMGKPEKIVDLARKMIQLSGLEPDKDIEIKFTGLRPGEKLYEELLSQKENKKSNHEKIQIAESSMVDRGMLDKQVKQLCVNARKVNIAETVKLMKQIAPEFKSKNSQFEIFDK